MLAMTAATPYRPDASRQPIAARQPAVLRQPVASRQPAVSRQAAAPRHAEPLRATQAPSPPQPQPVHAFERGGVILREGAPAQHWYEVVSGVARTCRVLADGRRLIGEFLLPGDVFGFELGAAHTIDVEAITPASVIRFPLTRFRDPPHPHGDSVAAQLHRLAFETVARTNARLLLLARQTAQERVASFILEMDRRLERTGSRIELPMTRQDVADYLCLTIETVCRTLAELRRSGAIAVDGHHAILICDRRALELAAGQ